MLSSLDSILPYITKVYVEIKNNLQVKPTKRLSENASSSSFFSLSLALFIVIIFILREQSVIMAKKGDITPQQKQILDGMLALPENKECADCKGRGMLNLI